ncbi:MAG TPA: hypothetical protein DCM62_04265 [Bacteroidales bacterium]|nr:hypothetical protein [Bacteroidales bacterium]
MVGFQSILKAYIENLLTYLGNISSISKLIDIGYKSAFQQKNIAVNVNGRHLYGFYLLFSIIIYLCFLKIYASYYFLLIHTN